MRRRLPLPAILLLALVIALALLSQASARFPRFDPAQHYSPSGATPEELAIADVDGDGHNDVLVPGGATPSRSGVVVMLGDRRGNLTEDARYPTAESPRDIAVGDLDGDHDVDIVTANYFDDSATVLRNDGDGDFESSRTYPIPPGSPSDVRITDLDRDGKADLVFGTYRCCRSGIFIMWGRRHGRFTDGRLLRREYGAASIYVGRLDANRTTDLALLDSRDSVTIYRGTGRRSRPFRRVPEPARTRIGYVPGEAGPPFSLVTGDFNRDGRADIATVNSEDSVPEGDDNSDDIDVSVLLGRGDGTYRRPKRVTVGSPPGGIATSDLNRDHKLDLIITHSGDVSEEDMYVQVLRGRGDGTFAKAGHRPIPESSFGVSAGRLDANRFPDFVVATDTPGPTVSVFRSRAGRR